MTESEVQERELKRRLATLAGAIIVLLALGTAGYCLTEGVSVWRGFTWTLDNVATIGSIPEPEDTAGQIMRVAAHAARRRDAVLRAGQPHRAGGHR